MTVEAPGSNPAVTGAIRHASKVTGTNFQYLVATAQVESGFNPGAAAATSSARGLFQFIEQTWLATLKEQAARSATARLPMPSSVRPPANMSCRTPASTSGS
jgi:hypothetical protein